MTVCSLAYNFSFNYFYDNNCFLISSKSFFNCSFINYNYSYFLSILGYYSLYSLNIFNSLVNLDTYCFSKKYYLEIPRNYSTYTLRLLIKSL